MRESVLVLCRCVWLVLALMFLAVPVNAAPEIQAIQFARGTSSAEVDGAVIRGDRALYSIEARRGQRLSLRISALEMNAVFQLFAPGAKLETDNSMPQVTGLTLSGVGEGDDAMRWSGRLPQSGRYLIVVGPTRGNASYHLMVTIR